MSIEKILTDYNVVAIIGFSDNHSRPSNRIGRYLYGNGFKVYGVNPNLKDREVDEIICCSSIAELPEQAEIINIFRRSEFVLNIIREILNMNYKPKAIWTQVGVISYDAKEMLKDSGIEYIENKCIMIEHSKI